MTFIAIFNSYVTFNGMNKQEGGDLRTWTYKKKKISAFSVVCTIKKMRKRAFWSGKQFPIAMFILRHPNNLGDLDII